MDLYVRRMREADFPVCAALLRDRLAYAPIDMTDLTSAWSRLLADQALVAVVTEDRAASREPAVLGFAAAVFVSDAWAAAAGVSREPYLTLRTLAADADTHRTPVLRPGAVDSANNAAGVNILNLHYIEHPRLAPEQAMALRYQTLQAFLTDFRGYRVRDVLQEFWDEIDPAFIVNGWGHVRNDYAAWFAERGEPLPAPGRRPYLVGFSREDAQAKPGDLMSSVFVYVPARFAFSAAEKRLLHHALQGLTDAELATAVGIALPTVKSQWRAIYTRVSRTAPELVADTRALSPNNTNRGQEKRRHLLEYLNRHPEELRPGLNERRRAR